jgi:hypothetical protein
MEHTMVKPKAAPQTSPGVFDLSSRYMAEQIDVPINDPVTGKPTGMTWTIASQFSKEAREAAVANATLALNAKGEVEATTDEARDGLLEQAIAATRGWNGFVVAGEPLAFSPENVRAILTDVRTAWIRSQVMAGYLSLSRFFG